MKRTLTKNNAVFVQGWDEVSEGAVHVAKETQNGCWADIRI